MTDRARSHWAWGYADKLPDDDARSALAALLAGALGVDPPAPHPLPDERSVLLPASRCPVPESLARFVTSERGARLHHTYGRGFVDQWRALHSEFAPAPDLVARPAHEDDVAAALAWASGEGVTVVPYGGGTSVVGGVTVSEGARAPVLSLDLTRMDRVLEVEPHSRSARIQAGARGPVLEEQLAPHGLSLRFYPQSFEFATLGGWLATHAGGHFSTLYTHIDEQVQALRMLTPTGLYATRRLPASGAGLSPERLVLGSEGTLGVLTEAWMRLFPRPRYRASASARFRSLAHAVDAVHALSQSGLHPSNCRLLDPLEAQLNRVADDGSAVVVLAFESADHPLEPWITRAVELCTRAGAHAVEGPALRDDGVAAGHKDSAGSWRESFLRAPYLQSALLAQGFVVDTFETACTWDAFAPLDRALREALAAAQREHAGAGLLSCRFTHVYPDGPAPYYTFFAPPGSDALTTWRALKNAACDTLLAHGATITHHHAVGRLHRPWYERERPEPLGRLHRAMKRELDPRGVLNPGVLL